ncbi:MAG: N-acetyltransferase [Acidobacteriota bacterium]
MTPILRPALDFPLDVLADVFTRGFEGYFVPIREQAESLAARLRLDSIDLALSRVAMLDDCPAGVVYVGVRGHQCRIAGMGVATEARRQGLGRRLMDEAITASRDAGLRQMVLEVIEQNEPAFALYRDLGFTIERRLVGYTLANAVVIGSSAADDASALVEIDPRDLGRRIAIDADADLPWQLASETIGAHSAGVSAVALADTAFALVGEPGDASAPLVLEALLVRRDDRRAGWGRRLTHALIDRHAGRDWRIPARLPEELAAPFLADLGFERTAITQWEMRRPL